MKSFIRFTWLILVIALLFTPKVSAQSNHRVLLMGDSLTAVTLNNWHKMVDYDHLVVAKGGQTTSWLLDQIDLLIASDEIGKYDTAVVWIGVNDPQKAVKDIPEIYQILRGYDIKIIGVTQWFHYCGLDQTMKEKIVEFDEIVRRQADLVLDFAVDPKFVDTSGYINQNAAADCIHMNQNTMAGIVSSAVNNAIEELYRPTPTQVPTETQTMEPTITAVPATIVMTPLAVVPSKGYGWVENALIAVFLVTLVTLLIITIRLYTK